MEEKIFEKRLSEAVKKYVDEEGEKYIHDLDNIYEPQLSKGFKRKIKSLYVAYDFSYYRRIAAVFIIILISGTSIVYSTNADLRHFINKQLVDRGSHIDVSYNLTSMDYDFSSLSSSWEYLYIPDYVTPGYEVYSIESSDLNIVITYKNKNSEIKFIQCKGIQQKLILDNENSDVIEVELGDDKGYFQKSNNGEISRIYWIIGDMSFSIWSDMDEKEILNIAKSIKTIDR